MMLAGLAFGQNEQAPIVEQPFAYKDWTYKNLKGDGETNLRSFAKGKKLVMVVYWAPWCPNWKHDAAFVQTLHDKYKDSGLSIIGVGEYDPTANMTKFVDQYKITFPNVYESDNVNARMTTVHYKQRFEGGDRRKWGSPWYVFLEPTTLEASGEFLTKKTSVVNGELMKADAEKYIREKLGLPAAAANAAIGKKDGIEVCDTDSKTSGLVKP